MKPGIENGLDLVTDSKPSLFEKFKPYLIILPALSSQ